MSDTPPSLPENPYHAPQPQPPQMPQQHAPTMGDDVGMRLLLPVGRCGWAIAAGYLGLFIIPGPIAIIVSIIAIISIQKSKNAPHPKHGMVRAIVGIIGGLIGTLLWITLLLKS